MIFGAKTWVPKSGALQPFVLELQGGYLVGFAATPSAGSPCVGCVLHWLNERKVYAKPADEKAWRVPIVKEALSQLEEKQSPHIFIETTAQGTPVTLECLVFPHPTCDCSKINFIPPREISQKTNLAFSPIFQMKCIRLGTPAGNLWQFTASGTQPLSGQSIQAVATHNDKETARLRALEMWLKKSSRNEFQTRNELREEFPSEDFFSGKLGVIRDANSDQVQLLGAGITQEEATLDALYTQAKVSTIRDFTRNGKHPMLVVGTNNWVRQKIPFTVLQHYDLYLLFYPNNSPSWVVGVAAFSRKQSSDKPIFAFASHASISAALEQALYRVVEDSNVAEWQPQKADDSTKKTKAKLNLWWTHWLYRCPKINLKDILHLEQHPRNLEEWREHLKTTHKKLAIMNLNSPYLPKQIRYCVAIQPEASQTMETSPTVRGIGTWTSFADSLRV